MLTMARFIRPLIGSAALSVLMLGCDSEVTATNILNGLPTYTLSAAPVMKLEDDGSAERQFTRIIARRLSNGDIVVGDRGAIRIAVFGRNGVMKKEIAHKGAGPGELSGDFNLTSVGDALLTMEQSPMSKGVVNVFDAATGFVKTITAHASNFSGRITIDSPLSNNSWIVHRGGFGRVLESIPAVGEFMSDTLTLGVLHTASNADSSTVQWLPPVIRSWSVVIPIPGATGLNGSPTALPVSFVFKGSTLNTTSGNRLWLANSISGELTGYDSSGRAASSTTLKIPRVQLT